MKLDELINLLQNVKTELARQGKNDNSNVSFWCWQYKHEYKISPHYSFASVIDTVLGISKINGDISLKMVEEDNS
jgi:hypothetical protein